MPNAHKIINKKTVGKHKSDEGVNWKPVKLEDDEDKGDEVDPSLQRMTFESPQLTEEESESFFLTKRYSHQGTFFNILVDQGFFSRFSALV